MVESALRQRVLDAVEQMPPTATLDDIIERLVFLAKVERGLAESDAGRLLPHDEVAARFTR